MELGVHAYLHSNYNHQIIYAKLNLKIYYDSSHKRIISNYQHENTNPSRKQKSHFNWKRAFANENGNIKW